jgi:hypothetical protein
VVVTFTIVSQLCPRSDGTVSLLQVGTSLHCVHSSLIYNSQKLERTQMPLNVDHTFKGSSKYVYLKLDSEKMMFLSQA